jgi:transcriptional regulator with XRE-family HTH domain
MGDGVQCGFESGLFIDHPSTRTGGDMPPMIRVGRRSQNEILASAVRLIRKCRQLKTIEVAERMNLALRSYEHFEAGGGRINLERIHRFAQATTSDPHGILTALAIGSPEFAVRTIDNKLMSICMVLLQDFDETLADAVASLDSRDIVNAFSRALRDLADEAQRRDLEGRIWLEERVGRLVEPSPADDGAASNL